MRGERLTGGARDSPAGLRPGAGLFAPGRRWRN